jgi:hypothetical protein
VSFLAGGFADVFTAIMGVSLPVMFAAFLFKVARGMLQHQLGIWAGRSTVRTSDGTSLGEDTLYDYRFIVDNIETVPLDLPLTIALCEEAFPRDPTPLFPPDKAALPPRGQREFREDVRVYSGASEPTFLESKPLQGERGLARRSTIRFNCMHARDTWTVRLLTTAASVTLRVVPDGVPLSRVNPLRPWLAITTSVSSITISQDGALSRSSRFQPTWVFAFWATSLSLSLYALTRWLLLPYLLDDTVLTMVPWWGDALILTFLLMMTTFWFVWIRRPIRPAIQGYRGFRSPTSPRDLQFEE